MGHLSLASQKLFLKDLFENEEKQGFLKHTKMWALYEDPLREAYQSILGLPPALTDSGRPLAEELGFTDKRHDGWGLFIHLIAEAYRVHPELEAELAAVPEVVAEKVIAAPKELTAAYSAEASKAVDREPNLKALKPILHKIPLAGTRAKNLYEAAERFTECGLELHELLSQRGDAAVPAASRKAALNIRSSTQGLITEARGALATEIKHSKKPLRADLEARVFGYADVLLKAQEEREAAARAAKKAENGSAPAPVAAAEVPKG